MTEPAPPIAAENHAPVPGLFCFQCAYDLQATPADGSCPECGRPVAESVSGSLSRAQGQTLRSGLVMLAISLYMIPVIPLFLTLLAVTGSTYERLLVLLGLMVITEHVLWAIGVGRAVHFAAQPRNAGADPPPRSQAHRARRARTAAWVCAGSAAATLFLPALDMLALRRSGEGLLVVLVVTVLIALTARIVSLLDGSAAAGRGLTALRYRGTATALRSAALAGVVASGAVGLGTLLLAVSMIARGSNLDQVAGVLLVCGVPAVWLSGLTGGVLCTVAAVRVNRRLREMAAV